MNNSLVDLPSCYGFRLWMEVYEWRSWRMVRQRVNTNAPGFTLPTDCRLFFGNISDNTCLVAPKAKEGSLCRLSSSGKFLQFLLGRILNLFL